MSTLAQTTEVTKRFGHGPPSVDRVNLNVGPGETVGLLGANGAGKTTLIRMLLGLLKPSSGTVKMFGEPPSRSTRLRLGYVPQSLGLYADLTVRENQRFAAAAFGIPVSALPEELQEHADTLVSSLPLGLQRRLAFAQALAHQPQLLVLDEPTSGVDPWGRAELWKDIHEAADAGAGALVSTHYMAEAEQCDRLIVMNAGRVVAGGSAGELVGSRQSVEVRAASWEEAFAALERADFPLALRGRAMRVNTADSAAVQSTLERAGIDADVKRVPASFEECFVSLVSS